MTRVESVEVELSIVLGRARMSLGEFVRLGRGAVIPLDAGPHDEVWVIANDHPIARGEIRVSGERICVAITRGAAVADARGG